MVHPNMDYVHDRHSRGPHTWMKKYNRCPPISTSITNKPLNLLSPAVGRGLTLSLLISGLQSQLPLSYKGKVQWPFLYKSKSSTTPTKMYDDILKCSPVTDKVWKVSPKITIDLEYFEKKLVSLLGHFVTPGFQTWKVFKLLDLCQLIFHPVSRWLMYIKLRQKEEGLELTLVAEVLLLLEVPSNLWDEAQNLHLVGIKISFYPWVQEFCNRRAPGTIHVISKSGRVYGPEFSWLPDLSSNLRGGLLEMEELLRACNITVELGS